MRAHVLTGAIFGTAAAFVASAVALAQAPIAAPAPSNAIALDASAPDSSTAIAIATSTSTPTPVDASAPLDAATPTPLDAAPEPTTADAAPATEAPDASYLPTNVGFSVTLRVGYSIPIGVGTGTALSDIVQGVIPLGAEVGWFFNPHLYVGGYFLYGIATSTNVNNDVCSSSAEVSCSASMLRFGAVARWHFRPEMQFDPWAGAGLGYDIINLEAQDDSAGALQSSGSLHGFDLTFDTGIDYKPVPYVGLGPYAELAAGHYSSSISSTSMHEWLTFGLRLRTNL